MAGTFSQIYIHIVFAVRFRQSLIRPEWEAELYKYITGIITNKGQKLLAINGMPDHIHILIGMRPSCCLSDLVREIKKSSDEFIKSRGFVTSHFQWQNGFGAFSHSPSAMHTVVRYILGQKEHHRRSSFREEYIRFLHEYDLPYEERFLFEWVGERVGKIPSPKSQIKRPTP